MVQGRAQTAAATSPGRFDLADIPPAPAACTQIEVTFGLDANIILHVSAGQGHRQAVDPHHGLRRLTDSQKNGGGCGKLNAETDARFMT